MNEQQKRAVAAEWHQLFEETKRDLVANTNASSMGAVGHHLLLLVEFAFLAGGKAAEQIYCGHASQEDLDWLGHVTTQEIVRESREAGFDVPRLDHLQALLRRGSHPDD